MWGLQRHRFALYSPCTVTLSTVMTSPYEGFSLAEYALVLAERDMGYVCLFIPPC